MLNITDIARDKIQEELKYNHGKHLRLVMGMG